jgi:hypothetical protein
MRSNKKGPRKKETEGTLKTAVENLINQEVRFLQLDRINPPSFILEEISLLIIESKREVVLLTESLPQKERERLIRKMIREAMEEEIERTVRHRGNPCLRCVHLRYYDWEMNPHERFPMGTQRARVIGCDRQQPVSRVRCERFIETPGSLSVLDYVDEMALLYEVREMFKKMKEIWEEYLML